VKAISTKLLQEKVTKNTVKYSMEDLEEEGLIAIVYIDKVHLGSTFPKSLEVIIKS